MRALPPPRPGPLPRASRAPPLAGQGAGCGAPPGPSLRCAHALSPGPWIPLPLCPLHLEKPKRPPSVSMERFPASARPQALPRGPTRVRVPSVSVKAGGEGAGRAGGLPGPLAWPGAQFPACSLARLQLGWPRSWSGCAGLIGILASRRPRLPTGACGGRRSRWAPERWGGAQSPGGLGGHRAQAPPAAPSPTGRGERLALFFFLCSSPAPRAPVHR